MCPPTKTTAWRPVRFALLLVVGFLTTIFGRTASCAARVASDGTVTKSVIKADPTAVNRLQTNAWRPWEDGFMRRGSSFECDNGSDPNGRRGLTQSIRLNQDAPEPIVASAWSKAEGVTGTADNDYSVYLDLTFRDGSHAWGEAARFRTGTHDWERREVVFVPEKPIATVAFYLLFRRHAGRVVFRDPRLQTLAAPAGATQFDGVPVLVRRRATSGFQVRDTAANSDFVAIKSEALGLQLETESTHKGDATFFDVRIRNTTANDRAVTLIYTIGVPAVRTRWLHDLRTDEEVVRGRHYWNTSRCHVGSNGRLSRYPLGAVVNRRRGIGLAIDMMHPAFFRIGYNASTEELYIAYDIALTAEKPVADVRFCRFRFDPDGGFRSALQQLYSIYPDYFRKRVQRQGLWMPFAKISQVRGWEDFGFRFKEGTNETAWDDAHGIMTFRYTEPMTWWMNMPDDMPRTLEAATAHARGLAKQGDIRAKVWRSSAFHDEEGRTVVRFRDEPWCKGAVWSLNSMPRVAGPPNDFDASWNEQIRNRFYGAQRKGDVDGEYIDSSEGYITAELDFRRDHFSAAQTPLCYSLGDRKPGVFRGLIAFEYIRGIERDVHRMNKLMMANATPNQFCWLAPMLDVMGTETNWNRDGKWRPMSDKELLYRRALCREKPFCFLMNTDFDRFPSNRVEAYMKRCLAYGMFPGFFSHNASEDHYFSRPELYNRDRQLFKKYVPLCRLVAEAGWEPLTHAVSSDRHVHVERFGGRYLTVYNDSQEPRSTTIRLVGITYDRCRDLVGNVDVPVRRGVIRISLGAEDVALLDLHREERSD